MTVLLPFNNYNSHKLIKAVVADRVICLAFCLNILPIKKEGGLHCCTVTVTLESMVYIPHWQAHLLREYVPHCERVFSFDIHNCRDCILSLVNRNYNNNKREEWNSDMRDTKGMRHGTFIFDCVDCIIDKSNDGHYGGLWRGKRRR